MRSKPTFSNLQRIKMSHPSGSSSSSASSHLAEITISLGSGQRLPVSLSLTGGPSAGGGNPGRSARLYAMLCIMYLPNTGATHACVRDGGVPLR